MSLAEEIRADAAHPDDQKPSGTLADDIRADAKSTVVAPSKPANDSNIHDPISGAIDAAGGLAETVANGALGTAGVLGGGLAESAGLATGSTDRAQRWNDWAKRNISTVAGLYDPTPETETGKGIQDAFDAAVGKVKQIAGRAGDATLRATGSPALAAAADTATQAAAQAAAGLAGAGAARVIGGGVPRASETVQSTLDQGRGKETVAVPTEGLERQVAGGGAAASSNSPYPVLTGQKLMRGGEFPQLPLSASSGDLPLAEQKVRSAIAGQILNEDPSRIRPGVTSGNEDTLRTEAAMARANNPTPAGVMIRDKMAQEQRGLFNYANRIIEDTGASPTLRNDLMRGDLVNSTLYGSDSLRTFIDTEKAKIYAEAAQRQGQRPTALPTLEAHLTDPTFASSLQIAGQPNFLPGVASLLAQFKTNGFRNPATGETIPANTVGAAMELHKALNRAWTPDNAMYIKPLKRAILDDVAQSGGADLYQRANGIHAAEQTLFDAPGMAKIFGEVNPQTGISKGLSSEKILPAANSLPMDQYAHLRNVLDAMSNGRVLGSDVLQVPDYLQEAARQSARELDGALVRDIVQDGGDKAGAWNANSANKTMNAYTDKLQYVGNPEVLSKLHTLNIGGQVMPNIHAYEGAPMLARRMDQAGLLEKHLPKGGAVIGGITGLPGGEVIGMKLGELLGGKAAMRRQMRQADETDAAMEAAAKLGAKQ